MVNKILDCTLRDGGYYNNWFFEKNLVNKYLSCLSSSGVNIVELGFRLYPQIGNLGPYAYSSDEFLKTLNLPGNLDIAVMINATDIINCDSTIADAIANIFVSKEESPVDIVRIAANIKDIEECRVIAMELDKLGYSVFLNLMQISSTGLNLLKTTVKNIQSWNTVEVLYFADSFGSMSISSINTVVGVIKSVWNGSIGIHTHDNKGHALTNSLGAIDCGVDYIDATILGMGRGAGNAKMEHLLVEIVDLGLGNYNPDSLFSLSLLEFSQLQEKYNWGSSIYYYLSAVHGIHPTYIQSMLDDSRYDVDQILSAIEFLKQNVSSSYSIENMLEALSNSAGSENGAWSSKGWATGRDVLIIGSGPSVEQYKNEITKYIIQKKPLVLCLNINQNISEELVDAYIACHEARISIELDLYSNLSKPIILPMGRVPIEVKNLLSDVDILDYGLKISDGPYIIQDNGCCLDKPLVLMYALSLLSVSGMSKVLLTGIDGYDRNSLKQQEMVKALKKYTDKNKHVLLRAITPTTYPIEQSLII
jgi:4-hydroxy 2-oxovalerate aldolase